MLEILLEVKVERQMYKHYAIMRNILALELLW